MRARSIRLRLTLWYAGTILVLLLAATVTVRTLVRQSLENEFDRALAASVGLVKGFFRVEIAEYRQIDATLEHISGELVIPDRRIEFLRPDGSVFVPRTPLPATARPAEGLQVPLPVRERRVALNPALAPGWEVRITASLASLVRQQRQVDSGALLAIPLAVALAMLAGWVLTGRTLRPVAQMADAADRITAGAGGRLPIAVPDDELGRLGARFNALLDRLDEALLRQRRFLADAAHELRTPIARARGAGELALSPGGAPAGDRAALEQTQHELETMSHLVDELLELARTEASGTPTRMEPLFLDDLVAEAGRAFDAVARRRSQRIAVEVPEEVPVQGDPVALQRLVGILVDNALRYSPACATITLRARRDGAAGVLEVEDAGIGIPDEERARLFERFFRGTRARQAAADGSGLGLAIAQAIAHRHGARIGFHAAPVQGTIVTVTFT
jgi:signal transduction histidine kinase